MAAVAVAVSGGRDSTALLHCTARQARELGLEVHALHVHHGLLPEADGWWAQVQAQCRRWARAGLPVSFHGHRLDRRPARGDSIEAWARRERYAALAVLARQAGCSHVLLAHHRRDQAETWLLQALRGGGPAGLSAMPGVAWRDGLAWHRPWLDRPREAIEAYVRRHRLSFVDDASNDDPRFARNRLRSQVWPALIDSFPQAEASLVAAARRAQEAAACLAELAALDLLACTEGDALLCARWKQLSPARQALLLRAWLARAVTGAVPESLLQRLLIELALLRLGRWPAPGGELRLHDGRLQFDDQRSTVAEPVAMTMTLAQPGEHAVPGWGGLFVVDDVAEAGIAAELLLRAELRPRTGGEQFQAGPRSVARSLKKQYQAQRLPAWQRGGPLVYSAGGQLLFVPGLGVDARCLAAPGEPQRRLQWWPDNGAPD